MARRAGADPYFVWDGRLPGDDDYYDNTSNIDYHNTLALADVVRGDLVVNVAFHCWDWDTVEDDLLGRIEIDYTVDNLWGLADSDDVHHDKTDEGEFYAYLTMTPQDVATDLDGNFRGRFFWKFQNFDTARMTPEVYGRTFTDIEQGIQFHTNPFEWLQEGWETFFYHAFYKKVGERGNCYGMSAEAIEAFHHRSRFAEPIFQHGHPRDLLPTDDDLYGTPDPAFDEDVALMTALNIRHGAQLGDRVVRWVADFILSSILPGGTIDDGRKVYQQTKESMENGDWSVLSMIRKWKSSSHTVLPIKWQEEDDRYEIFLADPSKRPLPPESPDVTDGIQRIEISKIDGSWMYRRLVDGQWVDSDSYTSAAPR